jgi:hypothetical protein
MDACYVTQLPPHPLAKKKKTPEEVQAKLTAGGISNFGAESPTHGPYSLKKQYVGLQCVGLGNATARPVQLSAIARVDSR